MYSLPLSLVHLNVLRVKQLLNLQPVSITCTPLLVPITGLTGLSAGAIAGIVISLVVVIILLITVLIFGFFVFIRPKAVADFIPPPGDRKGSMRLTESQKVFQYLILSLSPCLLLIYFDWAIIKFLRVNFNFLLLVIACDQFRFIN